MALISIINSQNKTPALNNKNAFYCHECMHAILSICSLIQKQSMTMVQSFYINVILIFTLNIFFFFSGICLNSVVILSLWRSPQLRKKLCYFMIMVLSCCDLLAVLTNHPLMACITVFWMSGKVEVYSSWLRISIHLANIFIGLSLVALLVMNFDRYLATSYPIYHRTSVTKRRLLTLVAILNIVNITLEVIFANDLVISYEVGALIFYIILCPPILFINYKLITIARKSRRNNGISPEVKNRYLGKIYPVAC